MRTLSRTAKPLVAHETVCTLDMLATRSTQIPVCYTTTAGKTPQRTRVGSIHRIKRVAYNTPDLLISYKCVVSRSFTAHDKH